MKRIGFLRIKLLLAVGLAAGAMVFRGQAVKADTCRSQVVLDNYDCEFNEPNQYGDCGTIVYKGGTSTYSCNTDLNQNPNCDTYGGACTSNDEGNDCTKLCGTDLETGEESCICLALGCSKGRCWESGGGGTGCGDGTCDAGEDCSNCPGDCGQCPCGGPPQIPDQEAMCIGNGGLFGKFYGQGDYSAVPANLAHIQNSCGPLANPSFDYSCKDYWQGVWDGYFEAPVEGDYEFMVKYMPQLAIKFDTNADGDFTDNTNESKCKLWSGLKLGDRLMFIGDGCDSKYRPKRLRTFLNSGTDPNPTCWDSGCDCWIDFPNRIACDEGVHCQEADSNASYADYQRNPGYQTPSSSRGTPECPIAKSLAEFTN